MSINLRSCLERTANHFKTSDASSGGGGTERILFVKKPLVINIALTWPRN